MKKIITLSALLCLMASVNAQSVVLNPSIDNTIYSQDNNTSNGQGFLYTGKTGPNGGNSLRRALLKFDFSSIPLGATITSTSLQMTVNNVPSNGGAPANSNFELHKLTTEFGEGTSNGGGTGSTAVAPDATWSDAMLGTSIWTTLGGDFDVSSLATTNIPLATGNAIWSSSTMDTQIQAWYDNPATNFGFILIGNEVDSYSAYRFGSAEQGTAPALTVNYTVPPCTTAPTAICQNFTTYIDNSGSQTITDADLDGGSSLNCGTTMTFSASQTAFSCTDLTDISTAKSLIISGVYDGPLTGGTPKGIELYVVNDITDLSDYGIGSANNGGGTDGQEFTFPADAATAGTYLYISSESPQFTTFFGFAPNYTSGAMAINGDDAVELFKDNTVIDVFGDINTDGTGQSWDFLDGWAYRNDLTTHNNGVFDDSNWNFSGINVFDGQSTNTTSSTPFPNGTYTTTSNIGTPVTLTVSESSTNESTCIAYVIVLDTLAPTVTCIGGTPAFELDATGNLTITTADIDNASSDNCSFPTLTLSQSTFTCSNQGLNTVTLYGEDSYGNIDSCAMDIMVNVSNIISIDNLTITEPLCNDNCNAEIEVINTGADNFSIDGGLTTQTTNTFNMLCAGDYSILVTSTDGCTDTITTNIVNPDTISATFAVINETCLNDFTGEIDMTVTGGSGTYYYSWTGTFITTEDITNLSGGTYMVQITDDNGCGIYADTTIVAGIELDLTYTVTANTITSNYPFGNFEWMNCADSSIITGENNFSYTASQYGFYAAIISSIGCIDTTECIEVGGIGFEENLAVDFNVYPNPTHGNITINLSNASNALIDIIDINGRVLKTKQVNNTTNTFNLSDFENGIYFVKVNTNNKIITKKISLIK